MSALGVVCAPAVVALEAAIVAAPANFPTSRRIKCVADIESSHGIRLPFLAAQHDLQFLLCSACFPRWTVVQLWEIGQPCPLWVRSRHMQCKSACPLYPR